MHGFRLNPTLSETEALAFEQARNVTLPADYRAFLTNVGDGGAGPCYGIFPLGQADYNFGLRPWREVEGMAGDLSAPFPLEDEWNDLSGMPDELAGSERGEYDRRMVAFEKTYCGTALINGAIPICHEGWRVAGLSGGDWSSGGILVGGPTGGVCGDQAGSVSGWGGGDVWRMVRKSG